MLSNISVERKKDIQLTIFYFLYDIGATVLIGLHIAARLCSLAGYERSGTIC